VKSARQELFEYMQLLRIRAGAPTYRQIRDGIGDVFSVSRVHNAINGPSLPGQETFTKVVNYLTDDEAHRDAARRLWEHAQMRGGNAQIYLVTHPDGSFASTLIDPDLAHKRARAIGGLVFPLTAAIADYRE
jgi:hypothetical protein